MYKARVEAVSGTKILAGGKWLQCIGNKNFRVGELAWTDGRCAYGNHYTPQQPLVITAPPQDEGIPTVFCTVDNEENTYSYDYYTCSSCVNAKKTGSNNMDKAKGFIVGHKRNCYSCLSIPSNYRYRPTGLPTSLSPSTFALNIDKDGNSYELREERDVTFIYYETHVKIKVQSTVSIVKNGVILKEINLSEHIEDMSEEAESYALSVTPGARVVSEGLDASTYKSFYIPWGVIENENNWAFMACLHMGVDTNGPADRGSKYTGHIYTSRINLMSACLYTPSERVEFFHKICGYTIDELATMIDVRPFDVHVDFYSWSEHNEEKILPIEVRIPIQDNYYFKINGFDSPIPNIGEQEPVLGLENDPVVYEGEFWIVVYQQPGNPIILVRTPYSASNQFFPQFMNVSIYDNDDTKLLDVKLIAGAYLTMCKFKGSLFLGVNNREGNCGLFMPYNRQFRPKLEGGGGVESGLYFIKNGELKTLLKGDLQNWKLRPMKKVKGWQNRIRDLPTE